MQLIILSSQPTLNEFEQGLDLAMTLADLEQEVQVLLLGQMLEFCTTAAQHHSVLKRLKQLQLFEIPCFATAQLGLACYQQISLAQAGDLIHSAKQVFNF